MEYRYLGRSGLKVSALSLGAWVTYGGQVGEQIAYECMTEAYDNGVNFFDNAEVYADGKAETVMGNVIQQAGWKRSDLVISTKIFWGGNGPNDKGLSRKHIMEGTDAALERLQMDYVDLLFCHRPDLHTPVEETVRAMNTLIEQGKVFYWGTSEWSAVQIMEAHRVAKDLGLIGPLMEQPQYNMFVRRKLEVEFSQIYKTVGMGTTIWSPLASGALTNKYINKMSKGTRMSMKGMEWLKDRNLTPKRLAKVEKLNDLALSLDTSLAKLAVAWCAKNENVSTVILGASKITHLKETLTSLDVLPKLTTEVLSEIETILENKPPHPMW